MCSLTKYGKKRDTCWDIVDVTEMHIILSRRIIFKNRIFRLNSELHTCPTMLVVIASIKSIPNFTISCLESDSLFFQ